MAHIAVSWPQDGSRNWGQQVDANLNAIVSQVNLHDDSISRFSNVSAGPQGPIGPFCMRFYTGSAWPARPVGTDNLPILNVSTPYPGAPSPTSPIDGDIWFP